MKIIKIASYQKCYLHPLTKGPQIRNFFVEPDSTKTAARRNNRFCDVSAVWGDFFAPAKTYPPTLQSRKAARAAVGAAADLCEEEDDDSRFVVRGVRQSRILSSHPSFSSLRPPPLPTKSRTATPSIPQRPKVIPHHAASRRPRLWRGGASERASRGLSAAADPPSQGAPLAARPPLPRVLRRERRRRSVRPSLTCREVRLLLLRTAAARCPCLPSHRPHAGPRASNHCSAGARSLAPVSSITRHKISSPFALF